MQPMRILIVDDHAALRKSMAEMLEKQEDVEAVVEASNGAEALAKLMEQSFDIMITDIVMPVMDGYTLMEEMRRLRLASLPKVIVATALARDDFVMRAVELGAKFYLVKPFEPENLLGHIRELANGLPASLPVFPQAQPSHTQSIDDKLSSLFLTIGIPAHIKGYQFLRDAILLAVSDHDYINAVTKRLYPEIAKRNATTASRVERAIRHAIEVAWDRGDVDTLNSYFGYTIHNLRGKPTNSEFIAMIADKMRLDKRQRAV